MNVLLALETKHQSLIEQLEAKYTNHINALLKRKAIILKEMQSQFYRELHAYYAHTQITEAASNIDIYSLSFSVSDGIIPPQSEMRKSRGKKAKQAVLNESVIDIHKNAESSIKTEIIPPLSNDADDEQTESEQEEQILPSLNAKQEIDDIPIHGVEHRSDDETIIKSEQADSENERKQTNDTLSTKKKNQRATSSKTAKGSNSGILNCEQCEYCTNHKGNLRKHLRVHSAQRPFECTHNGCNKRFKRKDHLSNHLLTHSAEKTFKCSHKGCKQVFARKSSLQRHIRRHRGQRDYKCSVCNKAFYRSDHLKNHLRIHTGERHVRDKKHKCSYCSKTFAAKGDPFHLNW